VRLLKPSVRWIWPIDVGFVLLAWLLGVVIGVLFFHTPTTHTVVDTRPIISNHATAAQVVANLDGKHVAGTGQFIAGFQCAAWTRGKNGHGWVVEYCVK
jgi:hypothetical protein